MSLDDFCESIIYAFDYFREELKQTCGKFFIDNEKELNSLEDFDDLSLDEDDIKTNESISNLPLALVLRLLKNTFKVSTNFDALAYAHQNGFSFDWDHLERALLEALSLDDFCPAVNYAWNSNTIQGVLKLGLELQSEESS
uniref:Uncharacterized protein n=1 Tax=Panagrellus redivivus TaxID=6233 RepID=A0A7E4UP66_PANRE